MILDWAKHCEKIYNTKELSRDDPADNKRHFAQEIIYLCYLRDVLGKNELQCYKEWKKITNGVASIFKDDEEQLLIEFNSLYKKSLGKKYQSINYSKKLNPVNIYNAEILFLNKLNVPMWVKQYWLCLLVYYKFMIQKYNRVQKTKTLNSWAIRQTEYKVKNYGGVCQDKIASYKVNSSKPIIKDYNKASNETYPTYVPAFLKKKGKIKYVCDDIDQIKDILQLLKPTCKKCEVCGKKFPVNPKTKRNLCEKCYKKYRIQRIVEFSQNKKEK